MGKGTPPPFNNGPTDHTWLIPFGGPNAEIMKLYDSIMSCGEPTFQNQVIVVDDWAGTEFSLKNTTFPAGVKVYENNGPVHSCAHALNIGLAYVATTWVWRMDADDRASGGHNRESSCREAEGDVVLLGGEMITQDFRVLTNHWDSNNIQQLFILHRNPIFHPATCIRTEALNDVGGWPEDVGQAEDYGCWICLKRIGKFSPIKNCWTQYTSRPGHTVDRQHLLDAVAERMGW